MQIFFSIREIVNRVIESEEVLQVAGNLLINISKDEKERAIMRSRKKFQMDYASDIATSRDIGKREGERAIAKKMKQKGISFEVIAEMTGLTVAAVERL